MTDISIKMQDEDKILSNQMLVSESIFLKSHEMVMDLIVFDMSDFDIILRMNFLNCYGAKIDCRKKRFYFN